MLALWIAAHRAVQVVTVRRELDEAAPLHLAGLRPCQHASPSGPWPRSIHAAGNAKTAGILLANSSG